MLFIIVLIKSEIVTPNSVTYIENTLSIDV
jgi:hypothetical protein